MLLFIKPIHHRSLVLKTQSLVNIIFLLLILLFPASVFGGCVEGDCENGSGTYTYHIGKKYVGDWKDSKKHGQGTYFYPDGKVYVGEFQNGKKQGQGTETYPDGSKYVGEFKKGKATGIGTMTYPDGKQVAGKFVKGKLVKETPPASSDSVGF